MSRTIDLAGVRQIVVEHFGGGAVTVRTGSDDQVRGNLEAPDRDFLEAVDIRQVHDQLRIVMPRQFVRPDAYLELSAPDGLSYQIATGSADIAIEPAGQQSRITSGSGDVRLGDVSDLTCTTGSGSIAMRRVGGQAGGQGARLVTGSGDVEVDEATVPLSVKAGSGSVRVASLSGELTASTASGDIRLPSSTASVDLRTASGSLTVGVAEQLPVWLDLGSASGRIDIGLDADAGPEAGEPYLSIRARTASGDITIRRA